MTSQGATRIPLETTELLIVGAGPVGLFAALCAARSGLQVMLLEQSYRGLDRGHAAILHPSTLRLMTECGLCQPLLSAGRLIDEIDLYVDGTHRQRLELKAPALSVAQSVLEELLLQLVRAEDVVIHSPCAASDLTTELALVQTRVVRRELNDRGRPSESADWEPVESWLIDSAFVIGADGYESRVRAALGIESSTLGPTETFAQFEGPKLNAGSTFELGFQGGLGNVSFPLPGERTRWGFQLAADFHAPADVPRLQALLRERSPWANSRRAIWIGAPSPTSSGV